jgi:hypothetical protein
MLRQRLQNFILLVLLLSQLPSLQDKGLHDIYDLEVESQCPGIG